PAINCGDWLMIVPSPATPAVISSASDKAQIKQMIKTCWRNSPWRNTKAFCAPMAMINEAPSKKPETAAEINMAVLIDKNYKLALGTSLKHRQLAAGIITVIGFLFPFRFRVLWSQIF